VTMPRQASTARPKTPRMAPTAINTVPSGSCEWFIKGAFDVGGTEAAGYDGIDVPAVLESVGRPVKLVDPPELAPVITDVADVDVDVLEPVMVEVPVVVDVVLALVVVDLDVVVVVAADAALLLWATPVTEKSDTARKLVRRSHRFSEGRDCLILAACAI
jgi:hypothetical protein